MGVRFVAKGYGASALRQSVLEIVGEVPLASLATVNDDGSAHISTAFVCHDGSFRFHFVSNRLAQHSLNVADRPTAALNLFSTVQRWGRPLRGVQLFGEVRLTRGAALATAVLYYGRRYRGYLAGLRKLTRTQRAASQYRFYTFTPSRLRVFDEPRFGEEVFITATVER